MLELDFNPEFQLQNLETIKYHRPQFPYLGANQRACLGTYTVSVEAKLLVILLCTEFSLKIIQDTHNLSNNGHYGVSVGFDYDFVVTKNQRKRQAKT